MRLPYRFLLVAVVAPPTPTVAQAPARADLVGTWVRATKDDEFRLSLSADSTWTAVVKIKGVVDSSASVDLINKARHGQWRFSGDTLWLGDRAATRQVKYAAIDAKGQIIKDSTVTATEPIWGAMKAVVDKGKLFVYSYAANDLAKRRPSCMDMYCFDRATP